MARKKTVQTWVKSEVATFICFGCCNYTSNDNLAFHKPCVLTLSHVGVIPHLCPFNKSGNAKWERCTK